MDRCIVLISSLPQLRRDRMSRCRKHDIGSKHRIVPDIDMGIIDQCEIEVSIDTCSKVHMMSAKVGMKRWLDIAVFSDLCKHFF